MGDEIDDEPVVSVLATALHLATREEALAAVDVALRRRTPGGREAAFKVKGSDVPGQIEGGRVINGEYDGRVLTAIDHAASQLPKDGARAAFVVMNAFRNWPLSATMSTVTR